MNLLVALFIDASPFCVVEGTDHNAHVDQVLRFIPCPVFGDVINFENAVGRHPCYWWWEEVYAADGGWFLCQWFDVYGKLDGMADSPFGNMSATSLGMG